MSNNQFEHVGMAWRCDRTIEGKLWPTVNTAFHVYKALHGKDIYLSKSGADAVALGSYSITAKSATSHYDMVCLSIPLANPLSQLGLSNLKISKPNAVGALTVASFNGTWGKAVGTYSCENEGVIKHTASTDPGSSGAPLISGGSVIGIHSGANYNEMSNVGYRWMVGSTASYQLETTAPDVHDKLIEDIDRMMAIQEQKLARKQVWNGDMVETHLYRGDQRHSHHSSWKDFSPAILVSSQPPTSSQKVARQAYVDHIKAFMMTIIWAADNGVEPPTYKTYTDDKYALAIDYDLDIARAHTVNTLDSLLRDRVGNSALAAALLLADEEFVMMLWDTAGETEEDLNKSKSPSPWLTPDAIVNHMSSYFKFESVESKTELPRDSDSQQDADDIKGSRALSGPPPQATGITQPKPTQSASQPNRKGLKLSPRLAGSITRTTKESSPQLLAPGPTQPNKRKKRKQSKASPSLAGQRLPSQVPKTPVHRTA